jgi:7-cyano-7-deazaguanine reductase
LNEDNLPFVGNDTWNAYEVSALTDNGLPVTGIAKIVYPCNSKYIVESKSIKLYFNSFNMTNLGSDPIEVVNNIELKATEDLSKLLETEVQIKIAFNSEVVKCVFPGIFEWEHEINATYEEVQKLSYSTLEDDYNIKDINFDVYEETPELLEVVDSVEPEVRYHSALLKSNCRVTSQPDWGDVYIYMKHGSKTIDPVSMLKYIVSFRDECHFHEEICETIYKRITDVLEPEELCVRCLYARRGGIDINPERASEVALLHPTLSSPSVPHAKTPKQ